MTHKCATCGGTATRCEPRHDDPLCRECNIDCPVCLGAGSFPDRMPARDAVADAETLRAVVQTLAKQESDHFATNLLFGHPATANTRHFDLKEAIVVLADNWNGTAYAIDVNTKRTISAARAAFRAVPGLRG